MRWIVDARVRHGAGPGLAWAKAFLARFDTSRVEWTRIDLGRGRYGGVYGRCHYPSRERRTYRISCQVPGPFPHVLETRKPPLYRREDGTWPDLPTGCGRGAWCRDEKTGREWFRVVSRTVIEDLDEAVVWIVAHEAFHFLRRTRQVPGRNTEIDADAFADEMLAQFRLPVGRHGAAVMKEEENALRT